MALSPIPLCLAGPSPKGGDDDDMNDDFYLLNSGTKLDWHSALRH